MFFMFISFEGFYSLECRISGKNYLGVYSQVGFNI